jgi:phage shock protein C
VADLAILFRMRVGQRILSFGRWLHPLHPTSRRLAAMRWEIEAMNIADEMEKLQALHARGALTDDEFARAKEAVLSGSPPALPAHAGSPAGIDAASAWARRLSRSQHDAWIGGVCGGLGEHTPLPSWAWRAIFLLGVLSFGVGIIPYVVLWICLPETPPLA